MKNRVIKFSAELVLREESLGRGKADWIDELIKNESDELVLSNLFQLTTLREEIAAMCESIEITEINGFSTNPCETGITTNTSLKEYLKEYI